MAITRFQPRGFDEIVEAAITQFVGENPQVTDFNKGSIIRTLIETVAQEQSRLYLAMMIGINEAIEESAYTTFGFSHLPAAKAYGSVRFYRTASANPNTTSFVPKGTVVSVAGSKTLRFETLQDLTLSARIPADNVTVMALAPGAVWNVSASAINTIEGSISDVGSVSNPRAFKTGADPEDDLQRRERFAQFLISLHRSTRSAILYGVKTAYLTDADGYIIERVVKASTIEQSPGLIWVYIHNGSGSTSLDLVARTQTVLAGYRDSSGVHEGWKAAGIRSTVFAATEVPQNVTVTIEVADGYLPDIVIAGVAHAIDDYFSGLDVGDNFVLEAMKQLIRRSPGVLDIINTGITPATNVSALPSQIIVRGNITISATDLSGNGAIDLVLGE